MTAPPPDSDEDQTTPERQPVIGPLGAGFWMSEGPPTTPQTSTGPEWAGFPPAHPPLKYGRRFDEP